MSNRQYEAYQVTAPYQNSPGLKCLAAIVVSQTDQAINLSDYFGKLGAGHYITLQADGAKIYVALGSNASGARAINEQAQGNSDAVGFPIPDGQMIQFVVQGGREIGTGYGTNVQYASGIILRAKLALSGAATGILRIWRNSMGPGEGLDTLSPPGF